MLLFTPFSVTCKNSSKIAFGNGIFALLNHFLTIKIMLIKRKMSAVDLAKILECSPTNIYSKLKRDNFSEKELNQIADILNCDFKGSFIMRDTREEI